MAEGKGKDRPQGFILKSLQDVGLEKISENTGPVKKNKKDTTVEPLRGRQINKMYKDEVKNIKDAYDTLGAYGVNIDRTNIVAQGSKMTQGEDGVFRFRVEGTT